MSAFFGIDARNARDFIGHHAVCMPHRPDGTADLHATVSPIKKEDIVFIKHCSPQLELHISAVGVVSSDYPSESDAGVCLPVEWVWQGEIIPANFDEAEPLCGEALYEEHNIQVQREILDLLPPRYRTNAGVA